MANILCPFCWGRPRISPSMKLICPPSTELLYCKFMFLVRYPVTMILTFCPWIMSHDATWLVSHCAKFELKWIQLTVPELARPRCIKRPFYVFRGGVKGSNFNDILYVAVAKEHKRTETFMHQTGYRETTHVDVAPPPWNFAGGMLSAVSRRQLCISSFMKVG